MTWWSLDSISPADSNDLMARGVKFTEEPRREPYGTVVIFEDLYGNRWDLIQMGSK